MNRKLAAPLVIAVVVLLTGEDFESASPTETLVQADALQLVKAYLHHDARDINGREMTTVFFAHPEQNGLEELGLTDHPYAETVRLEVMRDYDDTYPEYPVRRFMAQGATYAVKDVPPDLPQANLWAEFLEDDRFVARILRRLSRVDGADFAPPAEPLLQTRVDGAKLLASRVAASLAEREALGGCNATPATAAIALWDENPMLVSSILRRFVELEPEERTGAAALDALAENGWRLND
jgi:hypothetical protein